MSAFSEKRRFNRISMNFRFWHKRAMSENQSFETVNFERPNFCFASEAAFSKAFKKIRRVQPRRI
jgi:hypothetical protein